MPPAPAAGAPAALRAGGSGGPAAGGAEPRHPDVRELMSDECGALMHSPHTLQLLLEQGELRTVDPADVDWNIENCTEEYYQGGEAAVHIVCWHNRGAAKPINDGLRIALKVYHCPGDSGGFKPVANEDDVVREAYIAQRMQRKEVNVLDILRRVGCSDCIPTLQAVFQRAGNLQELPLYGYAMTAYQHGSLARYLRHTCAGLAPEGEFASFFGPAKLAAHYSRLHDILCRLSCAEVPDHLAELLPPLSPRAAAALGAPARPRRRGLLLQDISSNNLLVQETLPKGCTLLFSDPSRAELMDSLESPNAERYITATWMWGCMAAQHRIVDETADVYSTNICMLEVWAVAEGAPIPLDQLIDTLGVANDRAKGVTFARSLCTAMLKRHVLGSKSCGIVPRIRRELPLSWLMLWSILLGCDDFHSTGELKSGRRHRRPSVADMADVASQLAAVATQMEALEGGVSAAALDTPAGAALVEQCVQLYSRLAALTRLDDPTLLPADASLRWVATRFLQQDHPLVAAMKAQDDLAVISNDCCTLPKATATIFYFQSALLEAQKEAGWESGEQVFAVYHPTVEALCKEYRELQLEVLRLAPPGSELAQLAACSPALSSEGRRMAAALAAGFRLKDDTQLSYKRADVERYADALQRLILSELPPPGLEAQHALFRPINTAAKLAWFLGWWASKDRNAPRIPGLGMDFSTNGKSDRTKAVLDAAEEDGVFSGTISVAYGRTMPYAAQALLRRLLVSRPLFAAAVVEEMQEM
ncbi:hypothetical protein C2E21_0906 [Chlorella sorokiniana]|uniref:Uncharacterized protein n=1 Tax=Chlorella sorokiniana TaxID=3076 RepID=A0A2P6U1Q5_CHLSO|nr:hypothetical protein C2E21_0906 [Chlorella sorokiniana]|eukprot:PRW60229.1 hypothetical protein C2E21_0906 [Chlorella sorokiniana]